jgi:hypothetical protein
MAPLPQAPTRAPWADGEPSARAAPLPLPVPAPHIAPTAVGGPAEPAPAWPAVLPRLDGGGDPPPVAGKRIFTADDLAT